LDTFKEQGLILFQTVGRINRDTQDYFKYLHAVCDFNFYQYSLRLLPFHCTLGCGLASVWLLIYLEGDLKVKMTTRFGSELKEYIGVFRV